MVLSRRRHRPHVREFLLVYLLVVALRACRGHAASGAAGNLNSNSARLGAAIDPKDSSSSSSSNKNKNNRDGTASNAHTAEVDSAAALLAGKHEGDVGSGGVYDFSFSHVAPSDFDVASSSETVSGGWPPRALGLRECHLGDAGVAEVALSPWVSGERGVRILSLRGNQVCPSASVLC